MYLLHVTLYTVGTMVAELGAAMLMATAEEEEVVVEAAGKSTTNL